MYVYTLTLLYVYKCIIISVNSLARCEKLPSLIVHNYGYTQVCYKALPGVL